QVGRRPQPALELVAQLRTRGAQLGGRDIFAGVAAFLPALKEFIQSGVRVHRHLRRGRGGPGALRNPRLTSITPAPAGGGHFFLRFQKFRLLRSDSSRGSKPGKPPPFPPRAVPRRVREPAAIVPVRSGADSPPFRETRSFPARGTGPPLHG